jgi:hypothetical protein
MVFRAPVVATTTWSDDRGEGKRLLRQMQQFPFIDLSSGANPGYAPDDLLKFTAAAAAQHQRVFVRLDPNGTRPLDALQVRATRPVRTAQRSFGRGTRNALTGMAAEAVATDAGDVAWRSGIGTLGDVIAAVGRTYGAARKIATLWNAFVVDPAPALRQRGVAWAIEHLGVTVRVALGREPSRIAARIDGSETWVMAGTFVEVFAQGDGTVLQVRTGTPSVVDRIPRELDPLRMTTIDTPGDDTAAVPTAVASLLGFGASR